MDVLPFPILFLPDAGFFAGSTGIVAMFIDCLDNADISNEGDFAHD